MFALQVQFSRIISYIVNLFPFEKTTVPVRKILSKSTDDAPKTLNEGLDYPENKYDVMQ